MDKADFLHFIVEYYTIKVYMISFLYKYYCYSSYYEYLFYISSLFMELLSIKNINK